MELREAPDIELGKVKRGLGRGPKMHSKLTIGAASPTVPVLAKIS